MRNLKHLCFAIGWISLFGSEFAAPSRAASGAQPIKAGVIGLDGHALDWVRILNGKSADVEFAQIDVVAAYPGGSPDIPMSIKLLEQELPQIRNMGVEIVDSIDKLLPKVDVVLLLSIDGRKHLEQVRPVFYAGKPVFIDKPVAASLTDAIEIFSLAKRHAVPCFSSSALRFQTSTASVARDGANVGDVVGCDQYSPCPLEPTHRPDLSWYGIHGMESLLTIMGRGCHSVSRFQTPAADLVVCRWKDGRIGTYRGLRHTATGYGATIFGSTQIVSGGRFDGYEPLLREIVEFFKSGKPPVEPEETLELLAMIEAAEISKNKDGIPVSVAGVLEAAQLQVRGAQ